MHKHLKDLLNIIVIPTVFFGILTYWILQYYYHGDMTLEGYFPGMMFPFWVSHLILLTGHIITMVTVYFAIHQRDVYFGYTTVKKWRKRM